MKNINALLPIVEKMANEWLAKCEEQGLDVIVTSTYRTNEEQDALYAQGRTTPGSIVTKAKGGQSMHNYKVALDFAPLKNGKVDWNDLALFKRVADIGKTCGFTWGGDWVNFPDMPHLEYTAGYSLADFQNGNVDYSKFDIQPTYTQTVAVTPAVEPKIASTTKDITLQGILSSKTIWLGFAITVLQAIPQEVLPANVAYYVTTILGVLVMLNRFVTTTPIK
jgi:peptidoglycan L-alanyl-D-glutamate endopeptidase CwlK